MKPLNLALSVLPLSILLTACGGGNDGGGSSSSGSVPSTPSPISTADLYASPDFSFDVGQNITLSIDYQNVGAGALTLFSQTLDLGGSLIADPTSRVLTLRPSNTSAVQLEVNQNWQEIYAQWVPESADEPEQMVVIKLDAASNSYHIVL
ncbi:hypothetical protein HGP28_03705 [Vibrio sp. SM6]|uniref:CARDB domain-containing protein n=1 Tax=Vibrio agarilyticus TaxID=2726741 RepID=A0A7X8YG36_9VIBR|nr:hypothetical protein [Vibrio agarilyticus]NLS11996.1 hypothetical protein [Vibrio agarilyticus]